MGGRRQKARETLPKPKTAVDSAGAPGRRTTVADVPGVPRDRTTAARVPTGRDTQDPCFGARALEDLVRTVSALDGTRASALLSGLGEPLRARALRLLTRLEPSSRSDRHGQLADAFTPKAAGGRVAEGIPGRLGIEVQRGPAQPLSLPGRGSGPLARWARRLMLEIGAR